VLLVRLDEQDQRVRHGRLLCEVCALQGTQT
jgi:hypothetical protein